MVFRARSTEPDAAGVHERRSKTSRQKCVKETSSERRSVENDHVSVQTCLLQRGEAAQSRGNRSRTVRDLLHVEDLAVAALAQAALDLPRRTERAEWHTRHTAPAAVAIVVKQYQNSVSFRHYRREI